MYFGITLTEVWFDESNDYNYLIDADSPEEAAQKAAKFTATWYGEDEEDKGEYIADEDHWVFMGGASTITVSDPIKTTLEEYFEDHLQETYLIK